MKTTYQHLAITARFVADGVYFPHDLERKTRHNKFKITVRNGESGRKVTFDYYGSHRDWQNNKQELSSDDLINALYCFVSDAISGEMTFEDFCGEFGYDQDSRNAERIYKECVKAHDKAQRITDDLYDFANELNNQ